MVVSACARDIDCPADRRCLGGTCVPLATGGCKTDAQCPAGHVCLSNGACQKAECQKDTDCCPAEGASQCGRVCTNNLCYGQECTDGATKECFVACHRGLRTCERGEFNACDAPPLGPEQCGNGADDDCNGTTDDACPACEAGTTVACTTPCGTGDMQCTADGQLGPCSAPTDCTCGPGETANRACGHCGTEAGACGPDGTFVYSGSCSGEGCEPTKVEWRACGACGNQTRICGIDCTFGEWSECSQEGECEPGTMEQRGCTGACGVERRTCGEDCTFGGWSTCDVTGGCVQGETQSKPCGLCGTSVSTCDSECQWGPFGGCQGEGECTPFAIESETCEACGERTRKCTAGCSWSTWSECSDQGDCLAGTSQEVPCGPDSTDGPCEQGTATQVCGPGCSWGAPGGCKGAVYPVEEVCGDAIDQDCDGADATLPDDWEPNDSCAACAFLGTDPDTNLYATFDRPADVADYFCFNAVDGFNVIGFGERIEVNLMNLTSGLDADVYLYKGTDACKGGVSKALAKSEQSGTANDPIVWSESTGSADDGFYIVEVRNYAPKGAGCYKAYTLKVNGLN